MTTSSVKPTTDVKDLARYGGTLCLDFINSVDWRLGGDPVEYIHSYGDLLRWNALAGVLSGSESTRLAKSVNRHTAGRAYRYAISVREAMYRVIFAHMHKRTPSDSDMTLLNRIVSEARANERFDYEEGAFTSSWPSGDHPNRPLWTVALSFAHLLESGDYTRVAQCGGPECGWFFLDTSKNHKRRWCSMEGCGNRAKANRHYARVRVQG